jgi:hypothetical protein
MKTWLLRKLFFSKAMKNIRRGFWLEGYYEGKADEQYNRLLKGLENK